MDKADLFREAFKTFVRVQAAKRLAALGASRPEMQEIFRRSRSSNGSLFLPRRSRLKLVPSPKKDVQSHLF
jgi:hypothetical protein